MQTVLFSVLQSSRKIQKTLNIHTHTYRAVQVCLLSHNYYAGILIHIIKHVNIFSLDAIRFCYKKQMDLLTIYKEPEMIWTHPICSNFITFSLNTEQLLAQHIPLLGYTSLLPRWELANGCTETFFRGAAIPLTDSHLCCFLSTNEAPYPVEHSAVCKCFLFTTADNWWWIQIETKFVLY